MGVRAESGKQLKAYYLQVMTPDVAALSGLVPGRPLESGHLEFAGQSSGASAFAVDRLLAASAGYALAAADAVGVIRGLPASNRLVDLGHLLAYCTTHCLVDGDPAPVWADLSGVYQGRDGRSIQLHCNFPHHAAGVVEALGTSSDRDAVTAAIAERNVFELEAQLIDAGMIGAVIRTLDEWNDHPHAAATCDLPVITVEQIGDADPRTDAILGSAYPLEGIRVLDCSRVLAGPVAGSLLAGLGADVVRLGAEHLPSVPVGVMATGFGKRNAFADLRTDDGRQAMNNMLAGADVWVDAYRSGALAGAGFTPKRAAEVRPGIVAVQINAFDDVGPWAGRRGFDSIVQSTTGIRSAGGEFASNSDSPVGLPVQALDYATGFLAAGVASQLVGHQRVHGGSWLAKVSLLRTRNWLTSLMQPREFVAGPVVVDDKHLMTTHTDFGTLTTVRPFAGRPGSPPRLLGTSPPAW